MRNRFSTMTRMQQLASVQIEEKLRRAAYSERSGDRQSARQEHLAAAALAALTGLPASRSDRSVGIR